MGEVLHEKGVGGERKRREKEEREKSPSLPARKREELVHRVEEAPAAVTRADDQPASPPSRIYYYAD